MWVSLIQKSGNDKTGDIAVTYTEEDSCPSACKHKDTTCYARFGKVGLHWRKVREGMRGDNWTAFCCRVKSFNAGMLWRHNVAGDLPQRRDGRISVRKTRQLSRAARDTRGFTYTHYDVLTDVHNRAAVAEMNDGPGLVVNLSGDSPSHADQLIRLNIGPVTCILPEDAPHRGNVTPDGVPIVVCPAQTTDHVTCKTCKLCAVGTRKTVVGFLAHGAAKKRLSQGLR